ncbi:unnamed protein product, partial [Musa hybrid cultivar]
NLQRKTSVGEEAAVGGRNKGCDCASFGSVIHGEEKLVIGEEESDGSSERL